MHWLSYSLLATTLWVACWRNSEAQEESLNTTAVDPKENEIFTESFAPDVASIGLTEKTENRTIESDFGNFTSDSNQVTNNSDSKRDVENITFNDIKPFLLFPILPFLVPPREEENLIGPNEFSTSKNETTKIEGNPTDVKPFIFFDFAFNIRRIPISNVTTKLNDSKIINVKKLSINNPDDSKMDPLRNRKRRNTQMDTPGFFDDSPLFPDTELEEFLPKPELLFPDLPFHHKPVKKLSRRKRDQKKTGMKNDLKSFFDAFDEAFMRAKRELEWTDPILNLLRAGEQSFDDEKKETDELFSQLPDMQEKPNVKWRIQRNIKRLNNEQVGLPKVQDSPTIIVDKVVKIGEFHVHDDGHDKKKKKRGLTDSTKKFLELDNENDISANKDSQDIPSSIFELIKQDGNKRKKRIHPKVPTPQEEVSTTTLEDTKSSSQVNESATNKRSPEADKKTTAKDTSNENANNTEKLLNLMKVFDTLKGKMEGQLKPQLEHFNKKYSHNTKETVKALIEDNLKKNLTELLRAFLELNKNLGEKSNLEGDDPLKALDWGARELLEKSHILEKNDKEVGKDNSDFSIPKTHQEENSRTADLTSMFLHVTIPTVIVLGVIMLICFIGLQAKGKLCESLYKPREVLIPNEAPVRIDPKAKVLQAI